MGGPALTYYLTPTEEELFKKYNPDLQRKSLERRAERQQEFDDFVSRLKEYSRSDKPSRSSPVALLLCAHYANFLHRAQYGWCRQRQQIRRGSSSVCRPPRYGKRREFARRHSGERWGCRQTRASEPYMCHEADIIHVSLENITGSSHWRSGVWSNGVLESDYESCISEPRPSYGRHGRVLDSSRAGGLDITQRGLFHC